MKGTIAVGIIALGLSSAVPASAAEGMPAASEDGSTNIGFLAGLTFPEGGSKFTFGATATHKFTPVWGAGLYLTYWGTTVTAQQGETTSSNTVSALEGSYFFPDIVGLRLGGKLGLNFVGGSSTIPGITVASDNALVVGPHIGYDYQLSRNVSFGGEFNILFQPKTGSDSVTNLLAALKYWF
jgi:hypothetical protein